MRNLLYDYGVDKEAADYEGPKDMLNYVFFKRNTEIRNLDFNAVRYKNHKGVFKELATECEGFLLGLYMLSTSMTPINWQQANPASLRWKNIMVFGNK